MTIIKECSKFDDELTIVICFALNLFYVKSGRVNISSELDLMPQELTNYYKYDHSDEIMRMYRPVIRSTFQGLCSIDSSIEFSKLIWGRLGEVSECNPLIILWDGSEKMKFFDVTQ